MLLFFFALDRFPNKTLSIMPSMWWDRILNDAQFNCFRWFKNSFFFSSLTHDVFVVLMYMSYMSYILQKPFWSSNGQTICWEQLLSMIANNISFVFLFNVVCLLFFFSSFATNQCMHNRQTTIELEIQFKRSICLGRFCKPSHHTIYNEKTQWRPQRWQIKKTNIDNYPKTICRYILK